MLLEGACSRPPPKEANSGPVSGVEIMRKLSKSHAHNESALRIKVQLRSPHRVQCICALWGHSQLIESKTCGFSFRNTNQQANKKLIGQKVGLTFRVDEFSKPMPDGN